MALGTKRLKYLDDNMGALDVQLTAEEAAQLSAVIPEVVSACFAAHCVGSCTSESAPGFGYSS